MTDHLTAATARRDYLHPSMDARGANTEQAHLLRNDTAAVDSIAECIELLREHDLSEHPLFGYLVNLVERLIASNDAEGEFECRIAGAADTLVRELRRAELSGTSRALTAKAVARHLRAPLAVIDRGRGESAAARLDAFAAIHKIVCSVPRAQLQSPAVRHELGAAKADILDRLVGEGVTV
jgi:hypothetical protein